MTRRLTMLAVLLCAVTAMLFAAAGTNDGVKQPTFVPMNPDTSAPDAWGYTWVRSTDPGGPTFNWVDISTRGTQVTGLGDDNYVGPFPMQISFPYYWYSVGSFYVGSNGFICFSSPANFASPFAALPNTGATVPKDLLAICVGDLDFTVTAANPRCYYWSNGNDSVVVSFINVTEWQQTTNPNLKHTFQVVINKADSSITYQYGVQQGRYNSTNNVNLCIGWQNQTGQIGLSYTYSTTPPHALMPDSGLAIKIKRTVNTGLSVIDAGIVGGFEAGNLAKVLRTGVASTINAVVKNFGTTAISNAPVRYTITRSGQPTAYDTVVVPSLPAGTQVNVTFGRQFTPAVAGTYSASFNVTVPGDVGPGNNTRVAEISSAQFAVGQATNIRFENGTVSGSTSWLGGGGFGVAIDLPVYPVRVESVYVRVGTVTTQPMTVEILDGSSGVPGAVLATRTVTAVGSSLNSIDFRSDSVRIGGGRFFVGARGDMQFSYETTAPISFRTWEYTNGWAQYRSADAQDIIIRAAVRQENPPTPPLGWNAQTSGTTQLGRNVKAVSTAIAWAGFNNGRVYRTTNAGATWDSVGGGAIGINPIHCLTAIDQNTALVGSAPSTTAFIYRTSNGGATWTQVYSQAGGFLDGIHMYDASNGIAMGDPVNGRWTILRTANGGVSWVQDTVNAPLVVGSEAGWINSFQCLGSNIWMGTNANRIYRSTNSGQTWDTAHTTAANSYAVWFNNAQYGVAGFTAAPYGARSTNGGVTWVDVTIPGTGSVYGVAGAGTRDFWLPHASIVYRSTDYGATWATEYTSTIGTSLRHINFVQSGSATAGWVVSSVGGIASFYGAVTGIADETWQVPEEFALAQNFPNPFNPSTTIRYNVPRNAFVTLKVYDLLGQEVVTLRDEMHNVGSFEVVWNGHNAAGQSVASGVYFYRLEARPSAGGEVISNVNKMIMLK